MAEVKGDDQLEILPKLEETNTSTTETPNKTTDKSNGQKSTRNRQRRNRSPNKSKRNRSRSPLNRTNTSNSQSKTERQVYVANIPFETKWTDLKDLFRQTVGNVSFCKIFEDEEGRSRGCGLVEFGDAASAKRAIETMNRHLLNGRAIIVKEDVECERDDCGRLIVGSSKKDTKEDRRSFGLSTQNYNTFGLSQEFLESLDIKGNLFLLFFHYFLICNIFSFFKRTTEQSFICGQLGLQSRRKETGRDFSFSRKSVSRAIVHGYRRRQQRSWDS